MIYPYYQNQFQGQMNSVQANQDDRIWVSGRPQADAYLVAPGSFVRLWDSCQNVFYEKRTDQSGRPMPLKRYVYTEEEEKKEEAPDLRKELEALTDRIRKLEERDESKHASDDEGIQ